MTLATKARLALWTSLALALGGVLAAAAARAQTLPFCGDGAINQYWEQCDDGNGRMNDGCSPQCRVETWTCGDGVREGTELCDDGNRADGDGCSANCETEHHTGSFCGDGVVEGTEQCEPREFDFFTGESLDPCCATNCALTTLGATDPVLSCNNRDIVPADAPISFTAAAASGCWDVNVEITGSMCSKVNGSGRTVDKRRSCVVTFGDDTLDILDSGGVGDVITWTVTATDAAGNASQKTCTTTVKNPNK